MATTTLDGSVALHATDAYSTEVRHHHVHQR
jgi:hypothetical protein